MTNVLRRVIVLGGLALPFQALARSGANKLDLTDFTGTQFPDVSYAPNSDKTVMDIYVPKDAGTPPPLVMYVHGGAFWGGDKRDADALNRTLPEFMAAGIAVASVNYRLSGDAVWPAQRDDLAAALAYLRAQGAQYGYDADRLAVFGTSAGATLALIAGMDEAASGRGVLKAIAAWFPATLFTEMDSDMAQDVTLPRSGSMARKGSFISQLVGKTLGTDPEPALQASPITILGDLAPDVTLPPVLLAAGEDDRTISWRQSKRMETALAARANPPPVEFTLYPNSGHGTGAFRGEAIPHLVAFMSGHLTA